MPNEQIFTVATFEGKIYFLYEDTIDHCSYAHNLKLSGLNGIRTHDLCDTGAAQLSYQAIWELATL